MSKEKIELKDILKAVEGLKIPGGLRIVDDFLFVNVDILGRIAARLRDNLNKNVSNGSYVHVVKNYFSKWQYYLIEGGKVLSGCIMDCPKDFRSKIKVSEGKLLSSLEHLVCGDPKVPSNSGVKLLEEGRYIAELSYDGNKSLVTRNSFNRFARNYRWNEEISLRSCLFEMRRALDRAVVPDDKLISKLKTKLAGLYTKDKKGNKMLLIAPGKVDYLYSRKNKKCIFVRQNDAIIYCQPTL